MQDETVGLPRKTIDEFSTRELVDALKCRTGVEHSRVASSATVSLDVAGPSSIVVVRECGHATATA